MLRFISKVGCTASGWSISNGACTMPRNTPAKAFIICAGVVTIDTSRPISCAKAGSPLPKTRVSITTPSSRSALTASFSTAVCSARPSESQTSVCRVRGSAARFWSNTPWPARNATAEETVSGALLQVILEGPLELGVPSAGAPQRTTRILPHQFAPILALNHLLAFLARILGQGNGGAGSSWGSRPGAAPPRHRAAAPPRARQERCRRRATSPGARLAGNPCPPRAC